MLKGLEISEISYGQLERSKRLDSEFFRLDFIKAEKILANQNLESLTKIALVSDGNHMAISERFTENLDGVPYYRGQDVGGFFVEQSEPIKIDSDAFDTPQMRRSHLQKGDVLVSIVGTIGAVSLVTTEQKAACSCKLAILRPKTIKANYLAVFLHSKFGQWQINRFTRGAVQMGLILDDMDQIQIPRFTELFEQQISDIVVQSKEQTDASKITYARAENLLLEALGLTDFVPSLESVNVKSFKESFATTGRLDSEFYQPKFEKLINILSKDNLTIGNLAPAQHERFSPKRTGTFQYIEIGAVQSEGIATSETIEQSEAPSRASEIVKSGNVITSTVRPIRRLSALVLPTQDGYVCSSGFAVLKPIKILSETLLTYLRLPLVCELLDLYTTSSLYPAISEKDLLSIPIPNVPVQIQTKIAEHVQESFTLKAKSEHLLETAKRAVEMAIEQNEQTALAWLTLEIKPRT